MKVKFYKKIETLKKPWSEINRKWKLNNPNKSPVESLTNRMNHVKNTGMEDKVEKLNHSIRTHDWNTQKLYDTFKKTNTFLSREGENSWTKA